MRQNPVSLHLSNAKTSIICPSLYWLSCQSCTWSTCSIIDFVFDHMFETHVVGGAKVNITHRLFSCHSIVKNLISTGMKPRFHEKISICLRMKPFIMKRSAVPKSTKGTAQFSQHTFHKLSDGHSTRQSMRIND